MSTIHEKYLEVLKRDLIYGNNKLRSLHYFRSTNISVIIWFIILEYTFKKKPLNLEKIIDEVRKLTRVSKPTISKILEDGIIRGLIIKYKSDTDKRLTLYSPTELTVKEFKKWSEDLFNLKNN